MYSSCGNLREVIRGSRCCEKFLFFDVVLLKRCGKGQIEFARERLVKAVNRLGVVGRNGRSRKVGLALVLMVLTEGQREEQGRDVRVGLRKPAGGVGRTWRCVEGLPGGPVTLVKGQVAVIMDDTVDHNAPGRREPLRTTGPTATPTGGSRGPSSSRSP